MHSLQLTAYTLRPEPTPQLMNGIEQLTLREVKPSMGVAPRNSPPRMTSATMPLLSEHPGINLTTRQSPPNFSKPFGSLSRQSHPHSTLDQFRKLEQPPPLLSSPSIDFHRLRRKPSRVDLTAKLFAAAPDRRPVCGEAPLFSLFTLQNTSPSLHPPQPSTPQDYTSAASPSLTSTASTIQSSPAQSPHPAGSTFEPWECEESFVLAQPIRYKRKFPSIKQPKRLPRRDQRSDWCVYAAIVGGGEGDIDDHEGVANVLAVGIGEERESRGGAQAEGAAEFGGRRDKSVRFAGIASESSSSVDNASSGEEKGVGSESTYTLSKFRFPTPPSYNWAGTFGHLRNPTPPESPAILHYKGASFDVVNPHASLLLGTHNFETPAEIDGLLEDYFTQRGSSPMPYDGLTGEMTESEQSDNSRRTRMLYNDPEDARRNIMRIPDVSSQPIVAESVYQESPLARRGQNSGLPLSTTDLGTLDAGRAAGSHASGRTGGQANPTVAAQRVSSEAQISVASDPFDLNVSDDEQDDRQFDYIDQVVASGHGTEYIDNHEYDNGGRRSAVYDEGADAEATASSRDRDTTIANIVDAYDYSVLPLTPRPHGPSSSNEQGRAVSPQGHDSDKVSEASFVTNPFEDEPDYPRTLSPPTAVRLAGPPALPVPPPPVHLPSYQDGTDVQTSDQTYGATGELLQITPATRRGGSPSYPWPTGGSSVVTDPYPPLDEENKENLPPGDSATTTGVTHGVTHGVTRGIPVAWSNSDLPVHTRDSFRARDSFRDRGLTGNPLIRSSSRYSYRRQNEDDDWEDTQASETYPNLAELAGRPSQDSYADLSDDGTSHRLSLPAPQGQPTMRAGTATDGSPIVRFGNKAHRVLMSGPSEELRPHDSAPLIGPSEPKPLGSLKRAKQLLKANMMENKLMDTIADGIGSAESQVIDREQHRRNEIELENIRRRNPAAIKTAVEQVIKEKESRKDLPRAFRPPYNPQNSFEKIIQLGMRGGDQSISSDGHGVLEADQSPPDENLRRSETANTMATIRREAPPTPGMPAGNWSPLLTWPETVMTPRGRTRAAATPSTHRTIEPEEYEMDTITRCGPSRTYTTSQTHLLPMRLGVVDSPSPEPFDPGRRLTDAELIERAPNWDMLPSNRHTSRLIVPLPVNTANADDPRLINRDDVRNPMALTEQKIISRKYYCACVWTPISAALFGLGCFDWRMRALSQHGATEMCRNHKYWALYMATPAGCVFYSIFIVIGVVVYVFGHT